VLTIGRRSKPDCAHRAIDLARSDVVAHYAGARSRAVKKPGFVCCDFPDRRDLLVAVCVGEVRALCLLGEQLDADPDANLALTRWLRAYIAHVSARRGLAAAFVTGDREDSEFVAACQTAVEAIGTSLLKRAQDGGTVRADIGLRDVITLVNAIAMASETSDESEADRMLAIVLAGIAQPREGKT